LYACLAYSIRRLLPKQLTVLHTVSVFKAPFSAEFAAAVMPAEVEPMVVHLQSLARLGLLDFTVRTVEDGTLLRFDLHPMLRWYLRQYMPQLPNELLERYSLFYEHLIRLAYDSPHSYDQSAMTRTVICDSLPDLESALQSIQHSKQGMYAYCLALPYERLGQYQRAIQLYEYALEVAQEEPEPRNVASVQSSLATLLQQVGQIDRALQLYEQANLIFEKTHAAHEMAVTQNSMALLLQQLGQLSDATAMYKLALHSFQELGEKFEAAVAQTYLAGLLGQTGYPEEHWRCAGKL